MNRALCILSSQQWLIKLPIMALDTVQFIYTRETCMYRCITLNYAIRMDEIQDRQTDEQTDGQRDGQADGRPTGPIELLPAAKDKIGTKPLPSK